MIFYKNDEDAIDVKKITVCFLFMFLQAPLVSLGQLTIGYDELGRPYARDLRSERTNYSYGLHSRAYANTFIQRCVRSGVLWSFCNQMVSPNTSSKGAFHRIYGTNTPHILMPRENKWQQGIELLKLAQTASWRSGARICQIVNWYRPTPYNSAVGGARRSQHLNANAIDIVFCTQHERNKAHKEFKKLERRNPRLGIGTYRTKGSRTIHIDFATRNYGPLG